MDLGMIATAVITSAFTFGGTLLAARGRRHEVRESSQVEFHNRAMERLRELEDYVRDLETELRQAHGNLLASDTHAHDLFLGIRRGLHELRRIATWIKLGSAPPPPDIATIIVDLEALAESSRKLQRDTPPE